MTTINARVAQAAVSLVLVTECVKDVLKAIHSLKVSPKANA